MLKFDSKTFFKDLIAGLTTAFAAIALGAAFGVQSGRGAFAGMIAAAIIPIITSIFGGTRLQASGPTAPMTAVSVVVISSAYQAFGTGDPQAEQFITMVFLLSAAIMILAGLLKLGNLIQLVPQIVVIGFMNGIAGLIWLDQVKKIFGGADARKLDGPTTWNLFFATVTFATILLIPILLKSFKIPPKVRPFIPGTLVAIIALTQIYLITDLSLETVQLGQTVNSFEAFLQLIPKFLPSATLLSDVNLWLKALPFALNLALLGYLDSLLTSLVIDKETKETTRRNQELIAQGGANAVAAIFGGIPGAQATIRSVILLKEGAKTRLAGVFVGLFALIGIFAFQGAIQLVASSIFVGVLIKAGLDVVEKEFLFNFLKSGKYGDKVKLTQFLIICAVTLGTIFVDLNVAVIAGTIAFYVGKKYFGLTDLEDVSDLQREG